MKKTIFSVIFVILFAPLIFLTVVHADNNRMETTGEITFTGAEEGTDTPVKPEDPDEPFTPPNEDQPVNPNKPNIPGLWMITAPNIDFGSYDLKTGDIMKRNAIPRSNNRYNLYSVQVSDVRMGGKGWKVTASNAQFKNIKTKAVLRGATITFAKPAIYNGAQVDPTVPVTNNPAYIGNGMILDGTGASTTFMSVTPNKSEGNLSSSINWSPEQIVLQAPVGNVSSNDVYASSMYWTLQAAQ